MQTIPDKIWEAMDKTIQLTDKLIPVFEEWTKKYESVERARKGAKTAATTLNVYGASVAVAGTVLSGGLLVVPMGLSLSAFALGGHYLIDKIDASVIEKCMQLINSLLKEFEKEMEKLQSLVKEFNAQLEESMETHKIDWQGAMLLCFANSNYTNFNPLGFLIKQSKSAVKIDSEGLLKFDSNIGAHSMELNRVTDGLKIGFGGLNVTMIGISGTSVLVGVSAILAAYDVICLCQNFSEEHPTLEAWRKATNHLKEQKTSMSETMEKLKATQKAAKETVLQGQIILMQECLGGGYITINGRLQPITFEGFVNQIGDGREGGIYQLDFIAEMFGQLIEVFDNTVDGIVRNHLGTWHTKIEPSDRSLSRDPIHIQLWGDSGQYHYQPIDSNGNPIDVIKNSDYPNRCLFDAIAYVKGLSTIVLIQRFKAFLLVTPAARKVYESNLKQFFPEFYDREKIYSLMRPEKRIVKETVDNKKSKFPYCILRK